MFLHLLNDKEKGGFLSLAHKLVWADGEFASEEQLFLDAMKREMGLPSDEEAKDADPTVASGNFGSKKSRVAAMLELIGLAHADNEYHPDEVALLKTVNAAFDFSETQFAAMENWVLRQLTLTREADAMMQEGGH